MFITESQKHISDINWEAILDDVTKPSLIRSTSLRLFVDWKPRLRHLPSSLRVMMKIWILLMLTRYQNAKGP